MIPTFMPMMSIPHLIKGVPSLMGCPVTVVNYLGVAVINYLNLLVVILRDRISPGCYHV